MPTVEELQQTIKNLPKDDYAKLMDWVHELAEEAWDKQIEADVKAGKLDFLAAEALEAKARGELRCLPDAAIVFHVWECPDGGYKANTADYSIFTEGDDWEHMKSMLRDAVLCHFDDEEMPTAIRIHVVQNEVIPV